MKTVKVSKILRILKKDGWVKDRQKGSHRQFVHPTKKGTVTVNVEVKLVFTIKDIRISRAPSELTLFRIACLWFRH